MGVYIELPKEWAKWSFDVRDIHDNILEAKAIDLDLVRCGECKYFNLNEWDETICGVPIIVAHEICHKWGDGCKTDINGFCFMGERRNDDVRHNEQQDF